MKKLAGCAAMASCPAVYDPEDGSGELVIVGAFCPEERVDVGLDETVIRIPRSIAEAAFKNQS